MSINKNITNNQVKKEFFTINVGGMNLKLKSSYNEETIKQLANYVNQKFTKARDSMKSGSFQMAAILTALNIAEDHILLKKHTLSELDQIENKVQAILSDLKTPHV